MKTLPEIAAPAAPTETKRVIPEVIAVGEQGAPSTEGSSPSEAANKQRFESRVNKFASHKFGKRARETMRHEETCLDFLHRVLYR